MDSSNSLSQQHTDCTKADCAVKRIVREDIRKIYTFEKNLGNGMFGKVRLAYRTSLPNGNRYAIKSLLRSDMVKEISLDEELTILMKTDSPYIANF